MGRAVGAKDSIARKRRSATAEEVASRAAAKEAADSSKRAADQRRAAAAKDIFMAGMRPSGAGSSAAPESNTGSGDAPPPAGNAESTVGGATLGSTASCGDADGEGEQPERTDARRNARPADVEADGDDDDDDDGNDDNDGNDGSGSASDESIMGSYLKAVFDRLHSETIGVASRNAFEAKWLLGMLKEEGVDWWLLAGRARAVCAKLGLVYGEPAYYRNIKVWLPDEQWGPEAMPPCVQCESAAKVGVHGFQSAHFGRRICHLTCHYFTISRRYICHTCELRAKAVKEAAKAAGLRVEEEEEGAAAPPPYTFMGYDARSRARLPHGYGDDFPAFLTHRAGVDMAIVDLMRPLYDKGVRPEALSATLLELHAKAYTMQYEKREHCLKRDRRVQPDLAADMFSEFGDITKYAGRVASGRYLTTVYKKYEDSISDHLDKEVRASFLFGSALLRVSASYLLSKLRLGLLLSRAGKEARRAPTALGRIVQGGQALGALSRRVHL